MTTSSVPHRPLDRPGSAVLRPGRGTLVLFDACVPDATGTPVIASQPALVTGRTSRRAAGLRVALRSLRQGAWRSPGVLPLTLRAALRNLRGGTVLGPVVVMRRGHVDGAAA